MNPKSKVVSNYWAAFYVSKNHLCSLCGNRGVLDTFRIAISAAGVNSGGKLFCICPNGQAMRWISMKTAKAKK